MIRRITAITSALLAAGALTAGSATVADAATSARTVGSEAHLTASANDSCTGVYFENSYGNGNGQFLYARTGSPHQLLANTARTLDCEPGHLIQQKGTDLCFNVVPSSHQVDEATCNVNSDTQKINLIVNTSYGGNKALVEEEIQFVADTKACIYQDGRDSPVQVMPCNANVTGDEWLSPGDI